MSFSLEERVAHIEKDLEHLKEQFQHLHRKEGWIDKVTGTFKGDPDFEEILRLGREIRRADKFDQ